MEIKLYLKHLVIKKENEHCQKLKDAVWLLLYLLLQCDNNTWIMVRSSYEIAVQMGVSKRTVHRWLKVLQKHNYIRCKASEPEYFIHIRGAVNFLPSQKFKKNL